jgi:predicted ATPase/DNA-binding winged helix-turn-helix (wHTH) protein
VDSRGRWSRFGASADLPPNPSNGLVTSTFRFGHFELCPESRQLLVDGQPASLGARAFDVLHALMERRDRLVTKAELLDLVWPGLVVEENNLQVQISTLRKLLGSQVVATIPGRGYRFTAVADHEPPAAAPPPSGAAVALSADVGARRTNLPDELPPLYGRDDDLPAVRALIESHKLVTIVGAGGIGKTRLAEAAVHVLPERFADGVWFIDFAPVSDPALAASTVASTLNLRLGAEPRADAVADLLRTREMLIVFDNCEHLLDAVAAIAVALRQVAPRIRLLTTSQEPLKLPDEQMYRLDTLALPSDASVESATHAGAVALFVARVQTQDPHFELRDDNVGQVIDICRRLDGIALAIELAAARVPLLGVAGVCARLDERFRFLTAGARFAPRRHQTLRAALEWSCSMLTADESAVFRRLGAFVGGFGLDAAQRVGADDAIDPWAVLEILGNLVDKSLVVADARGEPRYRLLETGRAFALEQLAAAGETEGAVRNHALAMLETFEQSRQERWTTPTQVRLERYLPDLDNLRAALAWATGPQGDPDVLVALAGAACWLWLSGALQAEGLRWCEQVIARIGPATPPQLAARLYLDYAEMSHNQSLSARDAHAATLRATELYRDLGDRQGLYLALARQAVVLARKGEVAAAEIALQQAAELHDAGWPKAVRQPMLSARAFILSANGPPSEVRAAWEERLRLEQDIGDTRLMVMSLSNLVDSILAEGDVEQAIVRGRELVTLVRNERFSGYESFALGNLSAAYTAAGQLDEALRVARESVPPLRQQGAIGGFFDHFAMLAFKRGHVAAAALTLGCAEARYAQSGYQRGPNEQKVRDALRQSLQEALGPAELGRAMQEGAGLSDDAVTALALQD